MKYLSVGIQMTITILIMSFLGYQIDLFFEQDAYYFTLILSIGAIMGLLIKLVNRVNKEK
jgi:hypothetical protein